MENGEKLEDTVIREVLEETGYRIIRDTIKEYIKVLERRKGQQEDVFEMESYNYFCEVEAVAGDRKLDEYEEEYDYQVEWITLSEAIERNKQLEDVENCTWVNRDTKVMEQLQNR